MNAKFLVPPAVADTMLAVLHNAGYSPGECQIIHPTRGFLYVVDAMKDGERWIAIDESRYIATALLMELLGWDLEDG